MVVKNTVPPGVEWGMIQNKQNPFKSIYSFAYLKTLINMLSHYNFKEFKIQHKTEKTRLKNNRITIFNAKGIYLQI